MKIHGRDVAVLAGMLKDNCIEFTEIPDKDCTLLKIKADQFMRARRIVQMLYYQEGNFTYFKRQ